MESTAFSLRLLKTNIQAAAIAIGVQLEPGIRAVAKAGTAAIKFFLDLSKPVQRVIGIVTALAGALALVAGGIILFGSQIAAAAGLFLSLLGPIALVVAAVAGLYFAWQSNFMGIQDIAADAIGAVMGFLEPLSEFLGGFKDAWDAVAPVSDVMDQINQWGGLTSSSMGIAERALRSFSAGLKAIGGDNTPAWLVDLAFGFDRLADSLVTGGVSGLISQIGTELQNLVSGIDFTGIAASLGNWVLDVGVPTVTGWIADAAGDMWSAISTAAGFAGSMIGTLAAWVLDVATPTLTGWLTNAAGDMWSALAVASGFAGSFIGTLTAWVLDVGTPTVTGWILDVGTPILTMLNEQISGIDFTGIGLTLKNMFFSAVAAGFSTGEAIGSLMGSIGPQILDWATQQIEGVDWKSVGSSFATLLGAGISGTVIAFPTLSGSIIGGILNALVDVDWGAVGTSFLQLWVASMTALGDFFVGFGTKIGSELTAELGNVDSVRPFRALKDLQPASEAKSLMNCPRRWRVSTGDHWLPPLAPVSARRSPMLADSPVVSLQRSVPNSCRLLLASIGAASPGPSRINSRRPSATLSGLRATSPRRSGLSSYKLWLGLIGAVWRVRSTAT
jgi:hypothetical protein